MEAAHSLNNIDVFLYCNICGASPIHLVCNNDNQDYICANCNVELKFQKDDELRAKLCSAIERIDCLEGDLKKETVKNCNEMKEMISKGEDWGKRIESLKEELNKKIQKEAENLSLQKKNEEDMKNIMLEKSDMLKHIGSLKEELSKKIQEEKENLPLQRKLEDQAKEMNELVLEKGELLKKILVLQNEMTICKENLNVAVHGIFCICKQKKDDNFVQCSNEQVSLVREICLRARIFYYFFSFFTV